MALNFIRVKPCPKCKGHRIWLINNRTIINGKLEEDPLVHRMRCQTCGREGPHRKNPKEAKEAWNGSC